MPPRRRKKQTFRVVVVAAFPVVVTYTLTKQESCFRQLLRAGTEPGRESERRATVKDEDDDSPSTSCIWACYAQQYPDLQHMTESEAEVHYNEFGKLESRDCRGTSVCQKWHANKQKQKQPIQRM